MTKNKPIVVIGLTGPVCSAPSGYAALREMGLPTGDDT